MLLLYRNDGQVWLIVRARQMVIHVEAKSGIVTGIKGKEDGTAPTALCRVPEYLDPEEGG